MIIELDKIPFSVEYDTDDGQLHFTSIKLHGYELFDVLIEETIISLENKLICILDEQNEECKYENAIDDYQNRWVEL